MVAVDARLRPLIAEPPDKELFDVALYNGLMELCREGAKLLLFVFKGLIEEKVDESVEEVNE